MGICTLSNREGIIRSESSITALIAGCNICSISLTKMLNEDEMPACESVSEVILIELQNRPFVSPVMDYV